MLQFVHLPRDTRRVLIQRCRVPLTKMTIYLGHLAHCSHAFKEGADQGPWWCLNVLLGGVAVLELRECIATIHDAWHETYQKHLMDTE